MLACRVLPVVTGMVRTLRCRMNIDPHMLIQAGNDAHAAHRTRTANRGGYLTDLQKLNQAK
jgi:hypothetical protein